MEKKIGQLIEERVRMQKMDVIEFAELIGRTRANVYDIFKRENIDIALLKRIGKVLEYDFFQDLLEPQTKKEIIIRNSISNFYVKLNLTPDEVEKFGISDKVVEELK